MRFGFIKKFIILIPFAAAAFYFGCGSNKTGEISVQSVNVQDFTYTGGGRSSSGSSVQLANGAAVEAALSLDYRPLKAEAVNEADTLSAAELSGAAQGSGQGTVTGGGLRRLSD